MRIEEVENLLPLFEGAVETGRIKRKSLKNWLVKSLDIVFSICLFDYIAPTLQIKGMYRCPTHVCV
jgi:hypothetical protein